MTELASREARAAELRRFLDLVIRQGRFDFTYEVKLLDAPLLSGGSGGDVALDSPEILVTLGGRDRDLLLERNAELLLALEYLAQRWLRLDPQSLHLVRFDSGDYRSIRAEELKLSARVAADRVRETHSPFRFNPMSARDRRIIHLVLQDSPGVRTASEGAGAERQVVIFPADTK